MYWHKGFFFLYFVKLFRNIIIMLMIECFEAHDHAAETLSILLKELKEKVVNFNLLGIHVIKWA